MSDSIEIAGEKLDPPKNKNKEGILSKTQKFLNDKIQDAVNKKSEAKIAIFTHHCPDPDAIGSQMGLAWLLRKVYENVLVDCFYDGQISHPQNQRMVNLLDPDLKTLHNYDAGQYDLNICVDTIPSNCASPADTLFDLVVDHHKDAPNGTFKGLFLNLKAGSCCATIYQLIKQFKVSFEEDNDLDSKVATALMVGIITDTESQLSDDTTEYEHATYAELFEFRHPALKQIIKYKQPRDWVQAGASIVKIYDDIKEGVLIHGIGFITGINRDLIAKIADDMLSWEGVETCVAFAIIDGNRVAGSVRSSNAALAVPSFCKELGQQFSGGDGGGKLGKGAYQYPLGPVAVDGEMDDPTKEKLWEFISEREQKRLNRILRKS